MSWTCGSSRAGASSTSCACSAPAGPTSSSSAATWKPAAAPGPPSPRRLCTVAGFYRYAVEEEFLDHSPAAHVRRPRLDYESHAVGLDRNELGALLVAAGLRPSAEHALISLLALNGLRVSEATGADIEALGVERGHRTLVITRKGGKVVTIPLAPRTARAIDLATGERTEGPIFLAPDGRRLDRHGAGRIVRGTARRAGITKSVGPHTLRHAFITAALDAGVPLRDVQEAASHADPRTTMRYDRARTSLDRHATYIVAAYVQAGLACPTQRLAEHDLSTIPRRAPQTHGTSRPRRLRQTHRTQLRPRLPCSRQRSYQSRPKPNPLRHHRGGPDRRRPTPSRHPPNASAEQSGDNLHRPARRKDRLHRRNLRHPIRRQRYRCRRINQRLDLLDRRHTRRAIHPSQPCETSSCHEDNKRGTEFK